MEKGGTEAPPIRMSPALIDQYRVLLGAGLRPDRDVVFAILQLNDEAGREYVLAFFVELDALVAHYQLLGFHVGRLQRGLYLGGIGRARAIDRIAQHEEALHLARGGIVEFVAALLLVHLGNQRGRRAGGADAPT